MLCVVVYSSVLSVLSVAVHGSVLCVVVYYDSVLRVDKTLEIGLDADHAVGAVRSTCCVSQAAAEGVFLRCSLPEAVLDIS